MRFAFIEAEKAKFGTARLCRALLVSRAGFYAWRGRPRSEHEVEDVRLTVLIEEAFALGRSCYGSPRVHRVLEKHSEHIGRKRVARLMVAAGLKGRTRRKFRGTTDSNHGLPVAANLLDRQFNAERPNQRWVSDTTELYIPNGRLFLAVVMDLFSRFIVGWALSAINDRHLTLNALDAAVRRRGPGAGLLHHSDQGSTYASEDYQDGLKARGITCSMSRRGNCYDNAAMESWNSTLKNELGESFVNAGDAKVKLFDYIEVFYNQVRMHSAIGYVSPAEFETATSLKVAE